jgi:hypothetical protein
MISRIPPNIKVYDSFLNEEEHLYLTQHSSKVKSYANKEQKNYPLIISATEEWSQDYLQKDFRLQLIFTKFINAFQNFEQNLIFGSIEYWFIFSNLSKGEPISTTHGAHFDDNKWTIKNENEIKAPSIIAIFYLHTTPTALRVFNYDFNDRQNLQVKSQNISNFLDVECLGNRLVIFRGEKMHGVFGKLNEIETVQRVGLVFNLWEESPQRPWWF